MTREDAITLLRANVMVACDTSDKVGYSTPLNKAIEQALEMAIKALEQQTSDDCVSRQAVLDMSKSYNTDGWDSYTPLVVDVEDIEQLPPVTSTRKKGKWIAKENIHGLEKFYECSNCGNHCLYKYVEIGFQNAKTKFCPNCGAEMESEE